MATLMRGGCGEGNMMVEVRMRRLMLLVGAAVSIVLAVTAAMASSRPVGFQTGLQTEIPVSFPSGSNTLSGILWLPAGDGPHAAVVILSGSDREGTSNTTYEYHARTLVGSGVAVLVYDPPGVGRSTGDHRLETLDDRALEAVAAVDYLRSRPEIRPDAVGVWGVSQGGWVTQMAAAMSKNVAFVVSVSGSGVSVAEQQVYSVEAQSRAARFSKLNIAKAGLFARLLVDWQLTRPVYRQQTMPQVRRLGPGPWKAFADLVYRPGSLTPAQNLKRGIAILNSISHRGWARYLYLNTAVLPALKAIPPSQLAAAKAAAEKSLLTQPKKYLTAVRCPVLAIWGEDDTVVPARKSAALYRKYLAAAGNDDVTIVLFAHAGHSINNFSPAYWNTLTGWLHQHLAT
ncbi:MAG TPA: alpha/beta fold hydrolase [Gaiellaceae bacterium]